VSEQSQDGPERTAGRYHRQVSRLICCPIEPILFPLSANDGSHGCGGVGQAPVLVDLLRQVTPLASDKPEEILRFFVQLGEINDLGLCDDIEIIRQVLSLVSGSMLKFFGSCLREGTDWAGFKSRLLEQYFLFLFGTHS